MNDVACTPKVSRALLAHVVLRTPYTRQRSLHVASQLTDAHIRTLRYDLNYLPLSLLVRTSVHYTDAHIRTLGCDHNRLPLCLLMRTSVLHPYTRSRLQPTSSLDSQERRTRTLQRQ
jgi:hypothetical protein